MNIETIDDFFLTELQRAYGIETTLVEELPDLEGEIAEDALDDRQTGRVRDDLREVVQEHLAETEEHVSRLEDAFEALGERPDTRSSPALEGVLREKDQFTNIVLSDEFRPLFYLDSVRQVEQAEIGVYDRLIRVADHLDVPDEVTDALEQNRREEQAALDELDRIAGDGAPELLEELAASPSGE